MYDDFCIDEARRAAYVTVHRENRIDHISLPPGEPAMRPLAGLPFDELLLGPSSAAWSRAPASARAPEPAANQSRSTNFFEARRLR